jgi:uncharacterized protein (UPF0333 family)
MKRGQLTLFVILGLVLVMLVILAYVYRDVIMEQASGNEITETLSMNKETREVKNDMTNCIQSLAEIGTVLIGLQGGYTDVTRVERADTKLAIGDLPYNGTAYYYDRGVNRMPKIETMEKQLAYFIEENSAACQKKYEDMDVNYRSLSTIVKMGDDTLTIKADTDITITKEGKESKFSTINIELPVRLGKIHKVASNIVEEQMTRKTSQEICISCMADVATENGMRIDMDYIGGDLFYMITDTKSTIGGNSYLFLMANRF